VLILFFAGALLRELLCWANPPQNSFDDHFEPILLIMQTGSLPAKDACFQCYNPPVFYGVSAMIGNVAAGVGLDLPRVIKLLQFVGCVYGIATLGICYLILRKLPLSRFARLLAFGAVCFLPRHVYMSAMHSNDTLSWLMVAVSVLLALIALERGCSWPSLAVLSGALTITVFTKYTAFAILPAVLAGLVFAWRQGMFPSRSKAVQALLLTFLLPCALLGGEMLGNLLRYDSPLPWNVKLYDPSSDRPRDAEDISFLSFKPWEDMRTPMLAPGKLHSFWTLIYSGMWFDTEPYFLPLVDSNADWWKRYNGWYAGRAPFPGEHPSLSAPVRAAAVGLIGLGLVPLALIVIGCRKYLSGEWARRVDATPQQRAGAVMFPVLLVFNAAGMIALTLRLPVYNSMKPSYFLGATPAFLMLLAVGLMQCEPHKLLKRAVAAVFGLLFVLASAHVLHLALGIAAEPG
jgi:hypothetical protein